MSPSTTSTTPDAVAKVDDDEAKRPSEEAEAAKVETPAGLEDEKDDQVDEKVEFDIQPLPASAAIAPALTLTGAPPSGVSTAVAASAAGATSSGPTQAELAPTISPAVAVGGKVDPSRSHLPGIVF